MLTSGLQNRNHFRVVERRIPDVIFYKLRKSLFPQRSFIGTSHLHPVFDENCDFSNQSVIKSGVTASGGVFQR